MLISKFLNSQKEHIRQAMAILRTAVLIFSLAGLVLAQAPPKPQAAPAPKPKGSGKVAQPTLPAPEEEAEIPPEIPGSLFPAVVARVNSRPVLGREAERRVQAQLAPLGNPEWKNLKEDYRQELINQALSSLIAAELIFQRAVSSGMRTADAEVQAEFAKTVKTFGTDAEMNIALANRGLDRATYLKELGRTMTVERFVTETIGKKIVVTPAEVSQYYAGHREEFRHPDLVRTSHIMIMVPQSATPEQDKLALQRAQSLLMRARKGEDFAKLAKEYSMDNSASSGGDIGLAPKGGLDPEYEAAAFALPVGGISNVVRSRMGYHIIKVMDKKKEGIADLEEVRATLSEYLRNQKINAEIEKTVEGLRATARIEVLVPLATPLNFGGATVSNPRP